MKWRFVSNAAKMAAELGGSEYPKIGEGTSNFLVTTKSSSLSGGLHV